MKGITKLTADKFTVMFVCTGNTCRSPMAEGIMKELIMDEYNLSGISLPIRVISAGIHACKDYPVSDNAVKASLVHGIDISNHRPEQVTSELIDISDLILTMEKFHADYIKSKWPGIKEVYSLTNYMRDDNVNNFNQGIPDPVSMGIDSYMDAFDSIKTELLRVTPYIFRLARVK